MKSSLSLLWIFYMFNATYIDLTTLYYSVFINQKPKVHYTQLFLLGAAVLIEISIAMIVLSRILKYRANRRANISAGIFLTGVQFVTLFVGTPTLAYAFLSIILIATSAVIVWLAWTWSNADVPQHAASQPASAQPSLGESQADSVRAGARPAEETVRATAR
jgi:hypothetical protein